MSLHARSVSIFIVITGVSIVNGVVQAQQFKGESWPRDASNSEMAFPRPGEIRGPVSGGTVSVQELERPLEGRGLQMLLKGRDLIAHGDSARGLEQMRAALMEPSAEPYALAMLGAEHLKHGDYDAAIAELQAAVEQMPGVAASQSNLAYALFVRQRNDEALNHARKAVQLDPGRSKTRYVIGQILLQMGRREEAEFHLKRASEEVAGARALLAKLFTASASTLSDPSH